MKKSLSILLTDDELLDLCRILIDEDAEAALVFLEQHLKKPVKHALEGG